MYVTGLLLAGCEGDEACLPAVDGAVHNRDLHHGVGRSVGHEPPHQDRARLVVPRVRDGELDGEAAQRVGRGLRDAVDPVHRAARDRVHGCPGRPVVRAAVRACAKARPNVFGELRSCRIRLLRRTYAPMRAIGTWGEANEIARRCITPMTNVSLVVSTRCLGRWCVLCTRRSSSSSLQAARRLGSGAATVQTWPGPSAWARTAHRR